MTAPLTGQLPVPPAIIRRSPGATGSARPDLRVTALGGGHGLSASLTALRLVAGHLTAVVTVADDGGSSGTIRREMDVLPPGDLRMALAALCDDTDWGRTWAQVMQHRFRATAVASDESTLENHALGNLLIVALWELLGDPVDGLRWAGALLRAHGEVLPVSRVPLTIGGDVLTTDADGALRTRRVQGQVALARAAREGRVAGLGLIPEDAPATPEALSAIELADWVVIGPGSLYTSVLPHLLMPDVREALTSTPAGRIFVLNLHTGTQETTGMTHADHLRALRAHAPGLGLDVVVADAEAVTDRAAVVQEARRLGARVAFSRVSSAHDPQVHDPLRLAVALAEAMEG
ncbi:uridine diphosphate-N-acetylglucosamine-binding protein YvcK [Micrococcus sp.]|uniref:gluconeogenesis factor YvcK family protein n=1 Tax=Micrococcus sp. TaxID=1271 RepID=UPI002A91E80D|nr:uridine diphosphate-N-acetylglucosamine-binding protein YvcK [Micrococcus sp.]MDY6054461.1 uridine diphosphate-N-acetylglucosamine-binding protein YvcK [Micrococcus sp.]